MSDLEIPHVPSVADHLGSLTVTLNDANGTAAGMSVSGEVRLITLTGDVVTVKRGDPENFMPVAWKQKVKDVLDELRAEVAVKLNVDAS